MQISKNAIFFGVLFYLALKKPFLNFFDKHIFSMQKFPQITFAGPCFFFHHPPTHHPPPPTPTPTPPPPPQTKLSIAASSAMPRSGRSNSSEPSRGGSAATCPRSSACMTAARSTPTRKMKLGPRFGESGE